VTASRYRCEVARVYRDGLDALRRHFLAKRRSLQQRDDRLRHDAEDVLTKDALDNLDRARGRLEVDLDDLDELKEGDEQLVAYERLIRATERRVDDLRDERRRLQPVIRAAKVLAVLLVVVGGMGFIGWRHQEQLRAEALATKAKDCRNSAGCRDHGICGAERLHGFLLCIVEDDEDCAGSRGCELLGRCVLDPHGDRCIAAADADCEATPLCEEHGLCSLVGDRCDTTRAVEDRTVAEACDDLRCSVRGACTLEDGHCVAGDNHDCLVSQDCLQRGLCLARDGRCVADDASCLRSALCEQLGQCHARNGSCVAVKETPAAP